MVLSNLQVLRMELRKRWRGVHSEEAYVSISRSASDDAGSEFQAIEEGRDDALSSSSVSREAKVS